MSDKYRFDTEQGMWVYADSGVPVKRSDFRDRQASHPQKPQTFESKLTREASEVFDVPPEQVDLGAGPGLAKRARLGLLDSPESIQGALGPSAETLYVDNEPVVAYQQPGGTVGFADPPGLDVGDVPHFVSREGPAIVGGLLGTAATGGPWGAAGGAALGETFRRGAFRELAGGERLGMQDVGPIALQAAMEGGGAKIGQMMTPQVNALIGKGSLPPGQLRTDVQNINWLAKEASGDVPLPFATRFTKSPIAKATESQASATTAILQAKARQQQEAALRELSVLIDEDLEAARGGLRDIASDYVTGSQKFLESVTKAADPESGGKAVYRAVTNWGKKTRDDIRSAYGKVDEAAAEEAPIFNFAPMQDKDYAITAIADDLSPTDVARDPVGELRNVVETINGLDKEQIDYKVAKELRTRVFKTLNNPAYPWQDDRAASIARAVSSDLTSIMNAPINGAPDFVKAHSIASGMARHRFEMLGNPEINRSLAVGKYSPAELAAHLHKRPGALNPGMVDVLLEKYNAPELEALRLSVMDMTASQSPPGGAKSAFQKWRHANRTQARRLFAGYNNHIEAYLKNVDRLNSAPMKKIADSVNDRMGVTKVLVDGITPESARSLIKDVGGKGSKGHTLTRISVHEGILDKATNFTAEGAELNLVALQKAVDSAKNTGAWFEILLPNDRRRIESIISYGRLIGRSADVGTSLQRAEAVAALRHPSSVLSGLHTLTGNRMIATAITQDWFSRALMLWRVGMRGAPSNGTMMRNAGIVAGGLADYLASNE